jgi:hypothetical protein
MLVLPYGIKAVQLPFLEPTYFSKNGRDALGQRKISLMLTTNGCGGFCAIYWGVRVSEFTYATATWQ